jgi:hypothetical protein
VTVRLICADGRLEEHSGTLHETTDLFVAAPIADGEYMHAMWIELGDFERISDDPDGAAVYAECAP